MLEHRLTCCLSNPTCQDLTVAFKREHGFNIGYIERDTLISQNVCTFTSKP